jgi:hypothetical protein
MKACIIVGGNRWEECTKLYAIYNYKWYPRKLSFNAFGNKKVSLPPLYRNHHYESREITEKVVSFFFSKVDITILQLVISDLMSAMVGWRIVLLLLERDMRRFIPVYLKKANRNSLKYYRFTTNNLVRDDSSVKLTWPKLYIK